MGGILGRAYTKEIKNCYNIGKIIFNGEVDSEENYIAGIVGYALSCKISNVYNEKELEINGQNSNIRVGGIVARIL